MYYIHVFECERWPASLNDEHMNSEKQQCGWFCIWRDGMRFAASLIAT